MNNFYSLYNYNSTFLNISDIEISSLLVFSNVYNNPFLNYLFSIFFFNIISVSTYKEVLVFDYLNTLVIKNLISYKTFLTEVMWDSVYQIFNVLNNEHIILTQNLVNKNYLLTSFQNKILLDLPYSNNDIIWNLTSNIRLFTSYTNSLFLDLIYDIDLALLIIELYCLVYCLMYFITSNTSKVKNNTFYDDFITNFQKNNISILEFATMFTMFLGFIVFDIFLNFVEDDFLDAFYVILGVLVVTTFINLIFSIDIQYFYMVSSVSSGSFSIRTFTFDIINNTLGVLRIVICLIRYLAYDLQVEFIDFTFHFNDNYNDLNIINFWMSGDNSQYSWDLYNVYNTQTYVIFKQFVFAIIYFYLEFTFIILQILLSIFKYYIALFLFWLIIDLFILKSNSYSELK